MPKCAAKRRTATASDPVTATKRAALANPVALDTTHLQRKPSMQLASLIRRLVGDRACKPVKQNLSAQFVNSGRLCLARLRIGKEQFNCKTQVPNDGTRGTPLRF